jgi:endonuclease/exonuclease/phosphatase family metal-dependent hydrolase
MRLTTLNLRGFFDWDSRAAKIAAYLESTDSDVIVFQEVVFLPDVAPTTQVDVLNRTLEYPYRHASVTRLQASPEFGVYREGLAVLSRWPIPRSEAIVLHREEADPHERIVLFADVVAPDGRLWPVTDVHLSVRDDLALHHLTEILGIQAARGERRILAGDFNVNHLERHKKLWGADYTLTTQIEQYISFEASHQAEDYALVPRDFTISSIALSADGLSDHRGVTVDLHPV